MHGRHCQRRKLRISRTLCTRLILDLYVGTERIAQGDHVPPHRRYPALARPRAAPRNRLSRRAAAAHGGVAVARDDANHPARPAFAASDDVQDRPASGGAWGGAPGGGRAAADVVVGIRTAWDDGQCESVVTCWCELLRLGLRRFRVRRILTLCKHSLIVWRR